MLDEGPSKLFDALSAILGLGELTEAQELLAEARKAREKAHKDAGQSRDQIVGLLRPMDDERARTLVTAMERKDWGVSEAEAVLAQSATGSAGRATSARSSRSPAWPRPRKRWQPRSPASCAKPTNA